MRRLFPLLPLLLFSCTKSPTSGEGEVLVPRDKWSDMMVTALPTIYCRPEGFFRSCFTLDENACLDHAMRATKSCLLKIGPDLPATLKQPEDGRAWGTKVGECAGPTMEIALSGVAKKNADPKCRDGSQWKE